MLATMQPSAATTPVATPTSEPRVYHAVSQYLLPCDEPEGERLLLQHKVIKDLYEGRLVIAPIDLAQPLFILDCGTGAGVWLLDVARTAHPSSVLHGIDISARLFPLAARPPNVSLAVTSVTALPAAWAGRFDLVHQRLLYLALQRTQWEAALAGIFRVLRPGGWVQLGEAGRWRAGEAAARLSGLIGRLLVEHELAWDVDVLPRLLAGAGFVDIKIEERDTPMAGEEGRDARVNLMNVFRSMKTPFMRTRGLVQSEAELDALFDAAERECEETPDSSAMFYMICARKPDN
ncbi:S-adenosyl-L-methionine-dependent methyltransferase [Schizophyllum amplum]|uniref:S-adenosyl-L-methionine-dependent methyltransferase n=1 Tax=Schizophyllum amplum TaxID=97359 RepID=A0A550CQM0_9AGAR|nr:S-adenosyl-L-methionine-dependent methyltransferase [Auriculariopsis ampla]